MQMGLATLLLAWTFPLTPRRVARYPWTAASLIPLVVVCAEGVIVATGHGSAQVIDRANFVIGWGFWGATTAAALIVGAVRWYRLRHNRLARRRMQIAALGLFVSAVVLVLETASSADIPDVLYLPGLACFPIAIVVAVAQRDWFELDVTLNRGLVATICGAVLLVIYLATALLTARLSDGAGPLVSLPAAGLVAVCFAPVRWRAQRFIDHRLFGTGGDPRLVFHRLGVRLAASDDPESLMAAVVVTATESLRLDYAAVQLRTGDVWQTVCERGRRTNQLTTFDMIAGDHVVGRLMAAPRRDLKALSPIDRELLSDLASHSGVAARLAGLVTELRVAQQRVLVAREAERHRIHQDLHDSVGPSLVGLTLQLEVVAEMAQQTSWGELIARLHREAARTTQDVRRLVRDLRPAELDELGLPAAVAAAGARLDSPSGPRIECDAPPRWPELGHDVEDAAYKICLEAMTNCVRHSHATRCSVTLNVSGSDALQITIIDDGNGLGEHYTPGTGLASMRERAEALGGWLQIENAEAGGTRLDVQLPTPAFTP